jgi:hypothetical protein
MHLTHLLTLDVMPWELYILYYERVSLCRPRAREQIPRNIFIQRGAAACFTLCVTFKTSSFVAQLKDVSCII